MREGRRAIIIIMTINCCGYWRVFCKIYYIKRSFCARARTLCVASEFLKVNLLLRATLMFYLIIVHSAVGSLGRVRYYYSASCANLRVPKQPIFYIIIYCAECAATLVYIIITGFTVRRAWVLIIPLFRVCYVTWVSLKKGRERERKMQ